MVRRLAVLAILAASAAAPLQALAQAPQAPPGSPALGARAGNSYVPSTYTPGCGGILCSGDNPRALQGPPPPCEGLLCGMTPYAMAPPITAAQAQRMQEEQARAQAAAAEAAPLKPTKHARRHAKAKSAPKTVAARTPDPSAAAPPTPAR